METRIPRLLGVLACSKALDSGRSRRSRFAKLQSAHARGNQTGVPTDCLSSAAALPERDRSSRTSRQKGYRPECAPGRRRHAGRAELGSRARRLQWIACSLVFSGRQEWIFSMCSQTIHRSENTDDPGRLLTRSWQRSQRARTEPVVFPVHPRTRKAINTAKACFGSRTFCMIDPVGYVDMVGLSRRRAADPD